jgi:DHA2 family multidrug resistance protein
MTAVAPSPACSSQVLNGRGDAGIATWAGFALMCVALFMSVLDVQIVLTALPTIESALHIGEGGMSWIQTSYLTAEVISIPLSGVLARALSLRGCMVVAVAGFTMASLACGLSHDFTSLIVARTVQGLFGGVIIPCVFSAVFLLFSPRQEPLATGLAGVMAMLAPTLGPWLGGWLTVHFGWQALFTINLLPGVVAVVGMALLIAPGTHELSLLRRLDFKGLVGLALAMTGIQLALKEAPGAGWLAWQTLVPGLGGLFLLIVFVRRCHHLRTHRLTPLLDPAVLGDPRMALATGANAVLGATLYSSTYMMVIFLGLVRGHDALAIGDTLMITGAAQLLTAPIAVWVERRVSPVVYCLFGFALFGVGCAMNTAMTPDSDFAALMWPQIVRGAALMFCILGTTRLALGHLPPAKIANASGLFNLARNLGGAFGIGVVDTLLHEVSTTRAKSITDALRAGDVHIAGLLHLPIDDFLAMHGQPIDADMRSVLEPLIGHLALSDAINLAWIVLAVASAAVALACLVMRFRRTLVRTRSKSNRVERLG